MKYFIILIALLTISLSQDGKFSGVVHYQYSYDFDDDKLANYNEGFAITRVYLTYTQDLSEVLSYKFQTDINSSTSPKELYIKNAKVDWKSPIGKFTIGLQGMNVFNVAEKNWGFRFLEKSPMDKYKFSSSADMGVGYSGKLSVINYNLMVTNGTGYRENENDKYKKISTQFVYGEKNLLKNNGYNVGLSFTMENYDIEVEIEPDKGELRTKNKTLVGVFGGYAGNRLRVSGEYDMYTHPLSDITEAQYDVTEITSQIIAVYASFNITNKLEGLVRYDMYDPNTDTKIDGNTYLIAGLNYYPTKGLIITPNVRLIAPETGEGTTHAMLNFQFKF